MTTLTTGDVAPAFALTDQHGRTVRLEDYRGRKLAFDEKFELGFPLLADTDHAVAEAWSTWGERSMYGNTYMGIIRSSFLVDEDGRIAEAWYKVRPADTVPKALKALAG